MKLLFSVYSNILCVDFHVKENSTIAAVATFNVSLNMNENKMSLLSLANVEALAQDGEAYPERACAAVSYNWCYYPADEFGEEFYARGEWV